MTDGEKKVDRNKLAKALKLIKKACDKAVTPVDPQIFAQKFVQFVNTAGVNIDALLDSPVKLETLTEKVKDLDAYIQAAGTQAQSKESEIERLRLANARLTNDCRKLKNENDALAAKHAKSEAQRSALKAECERLRAAKAGSERVQAASQAGGAYVPFRTFASQARAAFGRDQWKSAFAFEAGMTTKEINAWETVGSLPADTAAMLDAMTDEQRRPASRQRWSADEVRLLKSVLDEGKSDLEAARLLAGQIGRRLYESSISGQRRRLFRGTGWVPNPVASTAARPRGDRAARAVH